MRLPIIIVVVLVCLATVACGRVGYSRRDASAGDGGWPDGAADAAADGTMIGADANDTSVGDGDARDGIVASDTPRTDDASDGSVTTDAPLDGSTMDAGSVDAGVIDAGVPDAVASDTGASDTGVVDAGVPEVGVADTGVADTGVSMVTSAIRIVGGIPNSVDVFADDEIIVSGTRTGPTITVGAMMDSTAGTQFVARVRDDGSVVWIRSHTSSTPDLPAVVTVDPSGISFSFAGCDSVTTCRAGATVINTPSVAVAHYTHAGMLTGFDSFPLSVSGAPPSLTAAMGSSSSRAYWVGRPEPDSISWRAPLGTVMSGAAGTGMWLARYDEVMRTVTAYRPIRGASSYMSGATLLPSGDVAVLATSVSPTDYGTGTIGADALGAFVAAFDTNLVATWHRLLAQRSGVIEASIEVAATSSMVAGLYCGTFDMGATLTFPLRTIRDRGIGAAESERICVAVGVETAGAHDVLFAEPIFVGAPGSSTSTVSMEVSGAHAPGDGSVWVVVNAESSLTGAVNVSLPSSGAALLEISATGVVTQRARMATRGDVMVDVASVSSGRHVVAGLIGSPQMIEGQGFFPSDGFIWIGR